MGHDGCSADDHGIMLASEDDDLGFTPDDYDTDAINAVLTLAATFVLGFILGRVL